MGPACYTSSLAFSAISAMVATFVVDRGGMKGELPLFNPTQHLHACALMWIEPQDSCVLFSPVMVKEVAAGSSSGARNVRTL